MLQSMLHICLNTYTYTDSLYLCHPMPIYIYHIFTENICRYHGVFGSKFLGQWQQEPPPPPEQEEEVEDPEAFLIVALHG